MANKYSGVASGGEFGRPLAGFGTKTIRSLLNDAVGRGDITGTRRTR